MKLKPIKPILVKYQWERKFRLVRIAIYIVLVALCACIYCAYAASERRLRAQDEKIQELRNIMINMTNIMSSNGNSMSKNANDIKQLKMGHTVIETKYGSVMKHGLIDKPK